MILRVAIIAVCLAFVACAQQPPAATPSAPVQPPADDNRASGDNNAGDNNDEDVSLSQAIQSIADQGGDPTQTLSLYVTQARTTQDIKLISVAAKLAIYTQQSIIALEMSDLWLEQEPDSASAWQIRTFAHVLQNLVNETTNDIDRLIELTPDSALDSLLFNSQGMPDLHFATLLTALANQTDKHPQQAAAWFAKTVVLQRQQQFDQALDACNQVLKLSPDHLEARLIKSQLLKELGENRAATNNLKALTRQYPENLKAATTYIQLLLEQQKHWTVSREIKRFNKQFKQQKDARFAIAMLAIKHQAFKPAERTLQQLHAENYRPDDIRFALAQSSDKQGKWQQAITYYLQVNGSRRLHAHTLAANLHYAHDQTTDGDAIFDGLRQQHPDENAMLFAVQASQLAKLGKEDDLWRVLDAGIAQFPRNHNLLYMKAMAETRRGEQEAAFADLRTILEDHPNDIETLNALGYILTNHSTRYQEAWYYIKRAHSRDPDNHAIQDSLGWVLHHLGKSDEAVSYLEASYQGLPDPEVAAHLIVVWRALGEQQKADELLQTALLDDPDSEDLLKLLPSSANTSNDRNAP